MCKTHNPNLKFKIINLVAYVFNLAITYGSLTGIFGATNTALSLKFQTLVTPVGWAFSIWGPIFIWEGVFALFQFLPRFNDSEVFGAISYWWLGCCAAQITWSIAFAQEVQSLAFICMLLILLCLSSIAVRVARLHSTYLEFWLLKGPFFLQLGWICAASIVNFNVVIDAATPTLMPNLTASILPNGTIVDGAGHTLPAARALNPAYFSQNNETLLLAAAVLSLAVLFLAGVIIGTYPSRVNGNAIVCGVVAWALGGVAAQLRSPFFKTVRLFAADGNLSIIHALSGAAAFLSVAMVLLVVALVGKLVVDEFFADKLDCLKAEGSPKSQLKKSLSKHDGMAANHELEEGNSPIRA